MILSFVCVFLQILIIPIIFFAIFANKCNENVISKIALSFGFSEEDIHSYGLDKYIYTKEFLKDMSEDKEKCIKKIEEFFKNIIYYIGPIQCALKTKDALFQINDMLEKLSSKEDKEWNEFNVEKI